jgi:hypothetical protein
MMTQDPLDGVGEVAAHGRNVFMGYLADPASTRSVLFLCSEMWQSLALLQGTVSRDRNDPFVMKV